MNMFVKGPAALFNGNPANLRIALLAILQYPEKQQDTRKGTLCAY
jgi:hypothetical protein